MSLVLFSECIPETEKGLENLEELNHYEWEVASLFNKLCIFIDLWIEREYLVAFLLFIIPDFETISSETIGPQFKDKDVFFCTLGTTRRAAGSAVSHNCYFISNYYNSSSLR